MKDNPMKTKTIKISEEAYLKLMALKKKTGVTVIRQINFMVLGK